MARVWILVLAGWFIECSHGTATIELKFLQYDNIKNGMMSSKTCCETMATTSCPLDECDPMFHVCLQDARHSMGGCFLGEITTGFTDNSDHIHFSSVIGYNTSNPMHFQIQAYEDSIIPKINVFDEDKRAGNADNDRLDYLQLVFSERAGAGVKQFQMSGQVSTLDIELSVRCDMNFYGRDCSTECISDSIRECNGNGIKVCRIGTDTLSTEEPLCVTSSLIPSTPIFTVPTSSRNSAITNTTSSATTASYAATTEKNSAYTSTTYAATTERNSAYTSTTYAATTERNIAYTSTTYAATTERNIGLTSTTTGATSTTLIVPQISSLAEPISSTVELITTLTNVLTTPTITCNLDISRNSTDHIHATVYGTINVTKVEYHTRSSIADRLGLLATDVLVNVTSLVHSGLHSEFDVTVFDNSSQTFVNTSIISASLTYLCQQQSRRASKANTGTAGDDNVALISGVVGSILAVAVISSLLILLYKRKCKRSRVNGVEDSNNVDEMYKTTDDTARTEVKTQ